MKLEINNLGKTCTTKEEPIQETLEEFAERLCPNKQVEYDCILEGAKWQAERMYSEEEVLELLNNCRGENPIDVSQWFNQYKKK